LVEAYLLKECKRSADKVKKIENGVDIYKYKPVPQKKENRVINGISIPDHKNIVSYLGRMSEEKAPDIFLKIANSMKDNQDVHFILAGDGPMWAQLMELMTSLNIDNVTFTGFAESVEVLAATDILLLPSRIDGRPNVVLESLSMGVPVIASNVGGLPWIISAERKNGIICEAGNILEFKNAILDLCSDLNKLNEFKIKSRKYAEEYLDVKYMQSAYLNISKA
jgi:glycosyltransferase involved in cell wall biosynthesis